MPKVSVILTSLNDEEFIRESIESILNQTFFDLELIIVDDSSSDRSWEIISSYKDSRIRCFRNEKRMRAIYGINKALTEVSRGKYIAIHHSDDVWEQTKLEKQVQYLEDNPSIGAVFTWLQIIDEHGIEFPDAWSHQENRSRWSWLRDLFYERNYLAHPSVLIRKICYEEVGLYRYGIVQSNDAEMWCRLLLKFPIYIIEERLTKHRLFSDQSNTSSKRVDTLIRLHNEWNIIRNHFLVINSFEELLLIFPDLAPYRRNSGFNIKFLLAITCVNFKSSPAAMQLGLSWLFELIGDEDQSKQIRALYSFDYHDLIKLTGTVDVYGFEERIKKNAALSERDAALLERDAALLERDAALLGINAVHQSLIWRLTAPIRFFLGD